MFDRLFRSPPRDERGITGLETAIILIAFVVVASVFAYTILSAGIFSSEKAKEAIHSGLETTRSSMTISGPILAKDTDGDGDVDEVIFVVSNALQGGEAVNLTTTTDSNSDGLLSDETAANTKHTTVVTYIDQSQWVTDITWTTIEIGKGDGDPLLETGEKFEITVVLTALTTALKENDTFTVEMKPDRGAALQIERTIPAQVDNLMDLR